MLPGVFADDPAADLLPLLFIERGRGALANLLHQTLEAFLLEPAQPAVNGGAAQPKGPMTTLGASPSEVTRLTASIRRCSNVLWSNVRPSTFVINPTISRLNSCLLYTS